MIRMLGYTTFIKGDNLSCIVNVPFIHAIASNMYQICFDILNLIGDDSRDNTGRPLLVHAVLCCKEDTAYIMHYTIA